jgi:hypothetical protein
MKLHILYESARIKDAKNALKEFDKAFDKFFPKFDTNEMEAYPEEFLCDEESGVFYLSYFVDQEQYVFKIHGKVFFIGNHFIHALPQGRRNCAQIMKWQHMSQFSVIQNIPVG